MRPLRGLLRTPIAERDRVRVFAACAAALLLIAALLAATAGDRGDHARPTTQRGRGVVTTVAPPAVPAPGPSTRMPATVLGAGRRFLSTYLPYLYGHARAGGIRAASRSLRQRLAEHPPRVSPATRRRHPRIVHVTARRLSSARWALTATIADGGVARYPIELVVAMRGGASPIVVTLASE